MRLTVRRKAFLAALTAAKGATDPKNAMPALLCVLIRAEGERARVAATNLRVGVEVMLPAKVEKAGAAAVYARELHALVSTFPDGDVVLEVDKASIVLRAGRGRHRLPMIAAEDYPPLPAREGDDRIAVDAALLASLISAALPAMSTDDLRPHLAGMLFQSDGVDLHVYATDGHRLAWAKAPVPFPACKWLVPHGAVRELHRFLGAGGSVDIAERGRTIFVEREGQTLSILLSDEVFPPVERFIPQSHTKLIGVAREPLVAAVKRVQVTSPKAMALELQAGSLTLVTANTAGAESSEIVDVDYEGETLRIGVNPKYLLDAIPSCDKFVLEMAGELDPIVVRGVDGLHVLSVIMPMRLD